MEMMLETAELCRDFKTQRAVNKVSLHVRKNTIYGLLGPNGAGKSTILKMVTGILKPTSGEIFFDGDKWSREHLDQIGALIETPPLYENLTAKENLKVRALLTGADENRITEVLSIVKLSNTGKKKAGQFSLGMKQRLGIALALLNRPKLLILDEPTRNFSPLSGPVIRQMLAAFPGAIISISHDRKYIIEVCEKVYRLEAHGLVETNL